MGTMSEFLKFILRPNLWYFCWVTAAQAWPGFV